MLIGSLREPKDVERTLYDCDAVCCVFDPRPPYKDIFLSPKREEALPRKEKDILSSLNVPWITKDGYLDLTKLPIDSVLRQSLSNEEGDFRSACNMLASMYSAGRTEAAVFLYGLFILHRNDRTKKELIIEALGHVKTAETADLLFRELSQTESSNSTRAYIDTILKSLRYFPLHLVEDGFDGLLNDSRWSYRMKQKFREILDRIRYRY